MREYNSNLHRSKKWLFSQKYISASDSLGDAQSIKNLMNWDYEAKISIAKIRYNRNKYPNKPNFSDIYYMIDNFYPFAWHPIRVDSKYNLVDGQHRYWLAKKCGLKYIDVFIERPPRAK